MFFFFYFQIKQSNALTSETKEVVDIVLTNDFAVENDCDQYDIGYYIKNKEPLGT